MNNETVDESPLDARDVRRAYCIAVGAVPPLKKGQSVWVLNGPFWHEAVIVRRLPGGVYWAQLDSTPKKYGRVMVCSNTFGGVICD